MVGNAVIDENGFRLNVGIILANAQGQLFWGRRVGGRAWQFPQGGIHTGETVEEALFRELQEEIGLLPDEVSILAQTAGWLAYRIPKHLIRGRVSPICVGQNQKWFLLKLLVGDDRVKLDLFSKPEFEGWQWVSYWYPLHQVVDFKREVYRQALLEFAPFFLQINTPLPDLDPIN